MIGSDSNNSINSAWPSVPLVYGGIKEVDGMKMEHETYHVYVNNDFIGDKEIITQNDDVFNLEKYLKNEGFHKFDTKLEGNRFYIHSDATESRKMKDTLNVHLHIRWGFEKLHPNS